MGTRNPFEAPHVESRRGGPVKAPLSREAVVTEALRQIERSGLKGMSLRKVAAALDTGAASIYAYVQDLDELHALVLDRALAKVKTRGAAGAAWDERLRSVLESYGRVLAASPGLAQLAFRAMAIGPNALRIAETLLTLLEQGGVDVATRAWAVDILLLHVTASVAEHVDRVDHTAPDHAVARTIAGIAERDYPRIYAARTQLLSGTPEQRFAWSLEVLLRGILETPRATKPERSKARPRKGSRQSR